MRLAIFEPIAPVGTRRAMAACWIALGFLLFFWRLGTPSFWDPDEAHYAETSREIVLSGDWLVPRYDGRLFFDKPILFHWFQAAAFRVFGATEFAARFWNAVAALLLLIVTAEIGARWFEPQTGPLAAMILAMSPSLLALARYASLDMLFSLFLFAAFACLGSAAVGKSQRARLPGFVLLGLAILAKGPLGLVLVGLAYAAFSLRVGWRAVVALGWVRGLIATMMIAAPWFVWMTWRFGEAFIHGYFLQENLRLFLKAPYARTTPHFMYAGVAIFAVLPWTPLAVARVLEVGWNRLRGVRLEPAEALLLCWTAAVLLFFTFSSFRSDRYAFPAVPAFALLAARLLTAHRAEPSRASSLFPAAGVWALPVVLVAVGGTLVAKAPAVPFDLPRVAASVPAIFILSGIFLAIRLKGARFGRRRGRPPRDWSVEPQTTSERLSPVVAGMSWTVALAVVAAFTTIIVFIVPGLEAAKPVKTLAEATVAVAGPGDRVASYRLDRWSASWRFYINRPSPNLGTKKDLAAFFAGSDRVFCALLLDDVASLPHDESLRELRRAEGLFSTTQKVLGSQLSTRERWKTFLVAVREPRSGK